MLLSKAADKMVLGLATTLRASVRNHLGVAGQQTIGHPTGNKFSRYAQDPPRSGAGRQSVSQYNKVAGCMWLSSVRAICDVSPAWLLSPSRARCSCT